MPLFRPTGLRGGAQDNIYPGDLIAGGESFSAGAISTAGDGTWAANNIATGIIQRTGPTGNYTDTTDTATNIILALGGGGYAASIVPGTSFRLLFRNTVAYAMTLAAGAGVTLGSGTTSCAASKVREYLFTILNASPRADFQCVTTNGSPDITLVLPGGLTAWPMGSDPFAVNITPGMIVTGTGIASGAKVLNITMATGGICGVTLDQNCTATSAATGNAITFLPNVRIDGLFVMDQ
jgi:hypothetical protein